MNGRQHDLKDILTRNTNTDKVTMEVAFAEIFRDLKAVAEYFDIKAPVVTPWTVAANRQRNVWLTDGKHVYFIPQGWCDDFNGDNGGLDYIDDQTGEPAPEIYCYAPTHTVENSPVETLFVGVPQLDAMDEITEQRAKEIHPEMFAEFERINREAGR